MRVTKAGGLAATCMCALLLGSSAVAGVLDFENSTDRFGTSLGYNWTYKGGQPTITTAVHRSGTHALYNNFNAPIGYNGVAIQALWMRSWAGFPASRVFIEGAGITISLSNTWQEVDLGGATDLIFRPTRSGVEIDNFGTFAIDDVGPVEVIPEPSSLALLALGLLAVSRRRRRRP